MRKVLTLTFMLAAAFLGVAHAQLTDRTESGEAIRRACVASSQWGATRPNVQSYCTCSVGFLSARMTDRQMVIVGRVAPYFVTTDAAGRDAEIRRLIGEGYTAPEVTAAAQVLIDVSDAAEATCARM